MGIVTRDDIYSFNRDPDNPNNPNYNPVKSAGQTVYAGNRNDPSATRNVFSEMTSPFPSKPTPTKIQYDAYGQPIQTPASLFEAASRLGAGPNDLMAKLYYGVDVKDTPFGGVNSTSTTPPKPINTGGARSGSGSAGGVGGMTAAEALALAKWNYEKEQDAKKLAGMQGYYDSGSYNAGFDNLLKMALAQNAVSEGNVKEAYTNATTNIKQGYDAAQDLGDAGYKVLNAYLAANPNNPYAGMQAQVGTAPDALTNWLSAYGVSDQPVRGQIAADQLQAQQGVGNWQNLINTLSALARQGAGSRATESELAQLLFNTGLGQEKAGYQSQASNAQAQALAALQQQLAKSQFDVESSRNDLTNQLAQLLASAGGNLSATPALTGLTNEPPLFANEPPPFMGTSYDVNRPVAPPPITADVLEQLQERRGTERAEAVKKPKKKK